MQQTQIMTTTANSSTPEMYFDVQQKTDKQHILDNPDTYIGGVDLVDDLMWVMDLNGRIVSRQIQYIPALFKLFDEGIVNCRDHVVRMAAKVQGGVPNSLPVSNIDIAILEDGTFEMTNDGNGIDVVKHPEYGTWVPELIFGHLRTSTNYDKTEKKIVGGKNGFGFKLVLIWSTWGKIETVDHIRGLKYTQEFKNNLDELCKPVITKTKAKPYTKITFKPDYARLGIPGLTPDMIAMLQRRVYDITGVTDKNVKVKYNGQPVLAKNFQQYIDLYIGDKAETARTYEMPVDRWEYAVAISPKHEFVQVSFVNGIYTSKGGKHVEYITQQITKKMVEYIEKKKKIKVSPISIKEQLMLFLRCDIENPAFESQTKDYMNTPVSKFGSKCDVSDKFIEKLSKMGIMETACAITDLKETKEARKTDGCKSRSIKGIPKLTDANWAGTDKSKHCTILFCEGDSAKTGVISGLSSEDRNTIGVYPLKGKVMNVRGESAKKVSENKEISEIKRILGLESARKYASIEDVYKHLRYSKVVFMTDQDLDGSHIKGLCINLFQNEWGSLTKIPGFIGFMNTPILKAKKGRQELEFYNDGEYNSWKAQNVDPKGWTIKYYKGLGTSTKTEFIGYFEKKKFVGFEHQGASCDDAIDMVFNKKRSDDRKTWLDIEYDPASYADTSKPLISYREFINQELIHFSKYDCGRSIPNLMDGLKSSLRKILFSAFKKNLTSELKVAQFSGYVSEQSLYHHGEESLNQAIIGMAQNYVGSNNINLLVPGGQFGSRIKGGKDASSPRYIYTHLEKITRLIYNAQDDNVLQYLSDDGTQVEPQFYVPIIPMILVNGSKGIGTGFSTDVMCYNPLDIIACLKAKLAGNAHDQSPLVPFYEGFRGTITNITALSASAKFMFKGVYSRVGTDKIRVAELPVGFWTDDFKELLEELQSDKDKEGKKIVPRVKHYDDNSKDVNIDFVITFATGTLDVLENAKHDNDVNGVEKMLKLTTTNSTSNMNLFDVNDKLKKFHSTTDIIDDYYGVRLRYYDERKTYLVNMLTKELLVISNKCRFITEILAGTVDMRGKKTDQINQMLQDKGYSATGDECDFKYLTKMPMDGVSTDNVDRLNALHTERQAELDGIRKTPIQQTWLAELEKLEQCYAEYRVLRTKLVEGIARDKPEKKTRAIKAKTTVVAK